MRYSFQRRLLLYVGASIVLFGALGAAAQFLLALRDLRAFQDDMLRQAAALALAHPGRDASTFGRLRLGDSDARIQVALLPIDPTPTWFRPGWADGLHAADAPKGAVRVLVRRKGDYTAVVSQTLDARNDLAEDAAWHALLPSAVLLPLLLWVVSTLVNRVFLPISAAAPRLASRSIANIPRLRLEGLPDEIQPFVEAIDALLQRTDRLVRQQQRFIADAAHELRSPLTALALQAANVGNAETLAQARDRLVPLERGIARASKLSEQLLDLAGVEGRQLDLEALDVRGLIYELLGGWHTAARLRGIDLGLDAPDETPAVASPVLLRMVLSNAVDNALKYTPAGGQVTMSIRTHADCVRCDVIDNGPGIPASARAAVFEPFRRLHGNEVEGTGLGLAIALEAARRMDVQISLHDGPHGRGLVFRLELPRG
ncbi:MAG: hypothetical protein KGL42_14180 [Betaproteobacteria bacterium]|nr:hypothetical protein [Betaproteobacteria bacterium]